MKALLLLLFLSAAASAQTLTNFNRTDALFAPGDVVRIDGVHLAPAFTRANFGEDLREIAGVTISVNGEQARLLDIGPEGGAFVLPESATTSRVMRFTNRSAATVEVNGPFGSFSLPISIASVAPAIKRQGGQPVGMWVAGWYEQFNFLTGQPIVIRQGLALFELAVSGFGAHEDALIDIGGTLIAVRVYRDPVIPGRALAQFIIAPDFPAGVHNCRLIVGGGYTDSFTITIQER